MNLIIIKLRGIVLTLTLIGLMAIAPLAQALQVVSSIMPIHSLVSAIAKGIPGVETHLLLPGNFSPHTYALRPSDRRLLQSADLIFWIGPDLESFLEPMLSHLPNTTQALALMKLPDLQLWPNRGSHRDHEDHPDHAHRHGQTDPHIWLSIHNALKISTAIEQILIARDPAHRAQYQQNAKYLKKSLDDLDRELCWYLAPVKNKPFMVFHDGYQYFEKDYELSGLQALTLHPESPLSISQKRQIQQIQKIPGYCVFSEPQFDTQKIQQWLGPESQVRLRVLDPLGQATKTPETSYVETIRALAESIRKCLD